jgi:reductive dehalogenase
MSKFHSVVSRRDFMKGLGLAGAGLGAAAATSPVFHDLDELMASPGGEWKRAWWVKEREYDDPVAEVDWSMLKRLDHAKTRRGTRPLYFSSEQRTQWRAERDAHREQIGWNNYTIPGKQLRDAALSSATRFKWSTSKYYSGPKFSRQFTYSGGRIFEGPKTAPTPEERGVPKWTGTPEEATRMLRAAMVFFGASAVYPGELNGKHRNIINATDRNKPILFENVPDGYETDEKYVLPGNRDLYEIGYTVLQSREGHRAGPTDIRGAANSQRYRLNSITQASTAEFLRGLGYICDGHTTYPITAGNGAAILHGFAEPCRTSWFSITPELDPVAGKYELITDLPLAPTKPIDSGIFRFCRDCGHCADICPSGSIPTDKELSWEPPPSPHTGASCGQVWKKIFWTNYTTCDEYRNKYGPGCYLCYVSCTFNTNRGALGHDLTRSMVGVTPIFNGFFYNMFKLFGYGQKDDQGNLVGYTYENYVRKSEAGESWWDMSLPVSGFDSTVYTRDGGYAK